MKQRLAGWALAGFLVGLSWVLISITVPLSREPFLWHLAQITFPIALFGRYHPIKWYWAVASNVPVYLLLGIVVEAVLRLGHWRPASA